MPSTIAYRRGDIVLVSFPFTDLTSSKRRPALILSPDSFNAAGEDLVLAAITSHITNDPNAVHLRRGDFAEGALPKASMVKTTKLFTMHSSLVAKRICALTPSLESLGGIDKRFAEISGEIPEFAGYYVDADGDLVTMLTDLTKTPEVESLIRSEVDAKLLVSGGQREYGLATYSFSQLLGWRDLLIGELMVRGDVALLDIDQARNQLYIGLISPAADAGVRLPAERAGIPAEALFLEAVGRPTADVLHVPTGAVANNIATGRFATTLGGVRARNVGSPDAICTLWLGVKQGGQQRYLTASHCTNDGFATLSTDLPMHQGSSNEADWLGDEQKDPADTCNIPDPVPPGADQDRCRWSDASMFGRADGATSPRFMQGWIARPVSEGGSLLHDHSADSAFTMDHESIPVAGDDVQDGRAVLRLADG